MVNDVASADEVVEEITAAGGVAVADDHDISTPEGAKALVDKAIDTFGGLDVVVNNAGILRDRMVVSMTVEEWDAVMAVHLRGTFLMTNIAANHWRERSKQGLPNDARIDQHQLALGPARATWARATTAPPRRASPPSRSSPRASSAATGSPSTPSRRAPAPT